MAFWKRSRSEWELASKAFDAGVEPGADGNEVTGTQWCSHPQCARQDAPPCAYLDRRGRQCPSCWCPEHQALVEGRPYCRPHAVLIRAFGFDSPEGGLPDFDNAAPWLVSWVFRDLHDRVRTFLDEVAKRGEGEMVGVDESARFVRPVGGGERKWTQAWKIRDHTGTRLAVAVEVGEAASEEIVIRVASGVVARQVPPWLSDPWCEDQDAPDRAQWYAQLFDHIALAVKAERTSGPRGPRPM